MKTTIASIIVAVLVIGGALLYSSSGSVTTENEIPANNVSVVDGVQIVEINVKGGYQPRRSTATAGIPTVVRFQTAGTYDCSIAVRIPSLSIAKNLPATATTDIELGTPKVGLLKGTCGMGMYPFEIDFIAS